MIAADEGPRRRSGRIAGLEADGDAFKAKVEEEEKEREILRVVSRKEREQVMDVGKMVEDTLEDEIKDMVGGVPFFFVYIITSKETRCQQAGLHTGKVSSIHRRAIESPDLSRRNSIRP